MSTKLQLQGLTEFRTALRNLPEDLAQEAGAIVLAHAEDAKQRIQDGYPEGPTGNLKRGVVMEKGNSVSRFAASAIVRSRAKHAWLYEHGTEGRKRQTRSGANRGVMPEAPEQARMIPKAIRVRRNMTRALVQVVRKAGMQVDEP